MVVGFVDVEGSSGSGWVLWMVVGFVDGWIFGGGRCVKLCKIGGKGGIFVNFA